MPWVSLCDFDEVPDGSGKYVEIDGFALAVFRYEGTPYVMDSTCPHAGHDISAGMIANACAVCPYHGWSFRLTTGEMPDAPGIAVKVYKTRLFPRPNQPTLVQADLPMP